MDLFASPNANNVHERSDIRLRQDSILTKKGLQKFIEHGKQYLGNSHKRSSGVEHLQPKALPYNFGNQHRTTPGAKPTTKTAQSDLTFPHPSRSTTPRTTFFADNQRYAASGGFKASFSKFPTGYDRQNMENYQLDLNNNAHRDWFGSSITRPPPGYMQKSSIGSSRYSGHASAQIPGFHERRNNTGLTGLSNLSDVFGLSAFQVGGAGSGDNFNSYNFSSYYDEPPKPDTPPTRIPPFSYDPVWSSNVTGTYEPGEGFGMTNGSNMHSVRLFIFPFCRNNY